MGMITSAILAATAIGAGIWGISQAGRGSKSTQAPMPMPEAPKVEDAAAKAEKMARAKRTTMARSKSIYTSPLGIGGEAAITKKTLLGQ